jgi:hypothetical protein
MMIDVATGIARILKPEGVDWVSTFPVCRVNNALGWEGVPLLMRRDDRYAVAVADAFSRITAGRRLGVCTFQGGVKAAGMQEAYAGLAQASEDGSPVLCITDGVPMGSAGHSQFDVPASMKTVSQWFGYLDQPERVPACMRRAFTMLRSGRPGPVMLAIPAATGTYDATADPYRPVPGAKAAPDPADVRAAEVWAVAPGPLPGLLLGRLVRGRVPVAGPWCVAPTCQRVGCSAGSWLLALSCASPPGSGLRLRLRGLRGHLPRVALVAAATGLAARWLPRGRGGMLQCAGACSSTDRVVCRMPCGGCAREGRSHREGAGAVGKMRRKSADPAGASACAS